MEILIVQIFVSLLLVAGAIVLFAYSVKQGDPEHADRLSILPLDDEPQPQRETPWNSDESPTTTRS
jgi:hypothetical protein